MLGARNPRGLLGGRDGDDWEFFDGDPSVVGLARPVGWRVLKPDATAAWDKYGTGDTQWTPVGTAASSGGVTSFNGATGAIGYAPVISVATPAALAAITTLGSLTAGGLQSGQPAIVDAIRTGAGPGLYTLQTAISSAPDNVFVIPTADDLTRQWVSIQIQDQCALGIFSAEVDLTAVATTLLLPPVSYKGAVQLALSCYITQKDGTVTTAPTLQFGANASFNDGGASQTPAAFTTQALSSRVALTGVNPITLFDLTTNGYGVKITSGAVLGTATVFKGRFSLGLTLAK